jgi:hypothetical protein
VLTSLAVGGDTSLELTSAGGDNQHGAISLGSTGNHVLDEVTVSRGIDDGDIELGSLELPQSNVNGDTTLALSLKYEQNRKMTYAKP